MCLARGSFMFFLLNGALHLESVAAQYYPGTPFTGAAYKSDKGGVFAHSEIKKGTVIFQTPLDAVFNAEACYSSGDSNLRHLKEADRQKILDKMPLKFQGEQLPWTILDVLCLAELVYEPFEDEKFGDWAKMLSKSPDVPMVWDVENTWGWLKSELRFLTGLTKDINMISGMKTLLPFLNKKKMRKTFGSFMSRTITSFGLVPGVDMFNHNHSHANAALEETSTGFTVTALENIEPGMEITFPYPKVISQTGSFQTLLYGFVDGGVTTGTAVTVNTFTETGTLGKNCDVKRQVAFNADMVKDGTLADSMMEQDIVSDEVLANQCIASIASRALAAQPKKPKKGKQYYAFERKVLRASLEVLKLNPDEEEEKARKELKDIAMRLKAAQEQRAKEREEELKAAEQAEQEMLDDEDVDEDTDEILKTVAEL